MYLFSSYYYYFYLFCKLLFTHEISGLKVKIDLNLWNDCEPGSWFFENFMGRKSNLYRWIKGETLRSFKYQDDGNGNLHPLK